MKKITFCLLLLSAAFSWSQGQSTMAVLDPTCAPVATFYQDFDGATVPALPLCWTTILRGETLDGEAFIRTVAETVHTAPNAVDFFNSNSNLVYEDPTLPTDDIILVSPKLVSIDGSHRLRFFAKGEGSLQIGTLSGNGADATFELLTEIPTVGSASQYIVDFSSYSGTNTYIGIRMNNANYNTHLFVDGISWEAVPTCPDVSSITVPSVATDGGTVTWTGGGTETNWEVAVAPVSVNDPDSLTAITSDASTKILAGLNPSTRYKVWVRSVCAPDNKGVWIGPVIFTTACIATNYVSESFDNVVTPDIPACWSTIITGPTIENSTIQTSEYNPHTAPYSIALSSTNPSESTEGEDNVILVSPNLTTVEGGYRLKFFGQGDATLQVGTLNTNTNAAVFTALPDQEDIVMTNTNEEYIIEFGAYSGTDHYVGIRLNNTQYNLTAYLDNIVWEPIPTCMDVVNVKSPASTPTTADITWDATDSESKWDVVYSTESVNPNTLTKSTVFSPSTVITELTPSTTYYVWVRSVCSNDDAGAWVGPVEFKTDCAPVDSFIENFDNTDSGTLPSCWKSIIENEGALAYVKTSTEPVHSSPNCIKLSNGNNANATIMLVSPSLSSLPLASHQLEFYARKSQSDNSVQLEIGTLDGNTAGATFETLQSVPLTGTTARYVIEFTAYSGENQYIGIRLQNATGASSIVYMDDIRWRAIPLCPDVTTLQAVTIGATTADLTWSPTEGSTWQVSYALSSVTDPLLGTILDTAVNDISLEELTASTAYNVWVRSICNDGSGDWTAEPLVFTTSCVAADLPYTEDFEGVLSPDVPACTTVVNLGEGNIWEVTDSGAGYGFDSHALTYSYNFDYGANTWFYTKGVNLTADTAYTISYVYGTGGFPENLKVMYGMSPNPEGMTNLVADYNNFMADPTTANFDFTPEVSGVYYLGFQAYSEPFEENIYIDDVKISTALAVDHHDTDQFKFYPNPVKDQLNLSYSSTISGVVIYNLLGQEVLNRSINANDGVINVSALSKGTYMVKVSTGNQVKVIKMIKE